MTLQATPATPPETSPLEGRRLLVIYNPIAGRRRRRRFKAVLERLEARGCAVSLRETGAPGDATRLARAARPGDADLVLAAGGDGTINEAANGLLEGGGAAPLPLAIVPLGTSNVLAAEIGLKTAPDPVARAALEGVPRRVSLGRIAWPPDRQRHFVLMAGVGLDARAVADVDPAKKRRYAQGAYVWAGLRQMLRRDRLRYRVEIDGAVREVASVIVAKAACYGGSFVLAPRARLDAPSFEVCLFEKDGVWPATLYGLALLLGRLERTPGFESVPAKRVRVTIAGAVPTGPEPVQCDGDDVARLPVEIDLRPDALDLLVPTDGPYG